MKKNYMTPSVKEIALRCDGMLLEQSEITVDPNEVIDDPTEVKSKDDMDGIFGW